MACAGQRRAWTLVLSSILPPLQGGKTFCSAQLPRGQATDKELFACPGPRVTVPTGKGAAFGGLFGQEDTNSLGLKTKSTALGGSPVYRKNVKAVFLGQGHECWDTVEFGIAGRGQEPEFQLPSTVDQLRELGDVGLCLV